MANEIILELKGRKPCQMPLTRIAAYMQEFATLIGSPDAAFFSGIRAGSTRIAARPRAAGGKSVIRRRIVNASEGRGPRDAVTAFRKLADFSIADRAQARVTDGRTAIIHFPSNLPAFDPIRVIERGHISGVLEGVLRDGQKGVKARIRPDREALINCTASITVGKEMAALFLQYVRADGSGHWKRESSGKWVCESFQIEKIRALSNITLREAVRDLRELDLDWSECDWDEFDGVASQS